MHPDDRLTSMKITVTQLNGSETPPNRCNTLHARRQNVHVTTMRRHQGAATFVRMCAWREGGGGGVTSDVGDVHVSNLDGLAEPLELAGAHLFVDVLLAWPPAHDLPGASDSESLRRRLRSRNDQSLTCAHRAVR